MKFVFPDVKDEVSVDLSDIVMILPNPKSAITARIANFMKFENSYERMHEPYFSPWSL